MKIKLCSICNLSDESNKDVEKLTWGCDYFPQIVLDSSSFKIFKSKLQMHICIVVFKYWDVFTLVESISALSMPFFLGTHAPWRTDQVELALKYTLCKIKAKHTFPI